MDKIIGRIRLLDTTPTRTEPLVQKFQYNVMTEWGDNILPGKYVEVSAINIHTRNFL